MPVTRVVVFDMGGVLVELAPIHELLGVDLPPDEFWPRWLGSTTVRAYERGDCDEGAMARGLIAELGLPLTEAEVRHRIARFPRGLYPGAAELVRAVVDGVATAILSNTNHAHWEHQIDAEVIQGLFDHEFLSYRMGVVKPDAEIFDRMVATLAVAPGEIVFLDDNQINVDAARNLGIDAVRVQGPTEAGAELARRGLLRPA